MSIRFAFTKIKYIFVIVKFSPTVRNFILVLQSESDFVRLFYCPICLHKSSQKKSDLCIYSLTTYQQGICF